MSQRTCDESRGQSAFDPLLTRPTLPARLSLATPDVEMMSQDESGPRERDVLEELARVREQNTHLNEALRSRTVIGQATGMLMATLSLSPDEAFAELTKMSSYANRKVRDVAAMVVATANASAAQSNTRQVGLVELLGLTPGPAPRGPAIAHGRRGALRSTDDPS